MAVYKPRPDSKTWWYEFQVGGERIRRDSETADRRKAMAAEAAARSEAKQASAERVEIARRFAGGEIGFDDARQRYMLEHGQHLAKAPEIDRALIWIGARFGADRPLSQFHNAEVARLVAMRRADDSQAGHNRKATTPAKAPPKKVSNATVNRDVVQPLRQLMRRARRVWSCHTPDVDWSAHMLKEPRERIREASPVEERAMLDELERGYGVAVEFAIATGCRLGEVVSLDWSMVNFFAGELYITGKGDKQRTLPMTKAVRALLEAQRGFHPQYVFTYVALRTRKAEGIHRGKRYPLTYTGLQSRFRRARSAAGVVNFRIHDLRHTAATRTLRAGKNLRAVQSLLGHSAIATTLKYAHVLIDDVRVAMEAAEAAAAAQMQLAAESPQQTPQQAAPVKRKSFKRLAKSA